MLVPRVRVDFGIIGARWIIVDSAWSCPSNQLDQSQEQIWRTELHKKPKRRATPRSTYTSKALHRCHREREQTIDPHDHGIFFRLTPRLEEVEE